MIHIVYITVAYNAAAVVQRTLDSVGRQDYRQLTHMIIDGASTDNTLAMVQSYASVQEATGNGHRVVIVSEPDSGIYDAMNKGLRLLATMQAEETAEGVGYVCFLNAGDFLPTADIASRIAGAVTGPDYPAVVYGHTDIVDGDGRFLHHRRLAPPEHLSWRSFRKGMLVCHQAFYARADLAAATPYDRQYRYSADVDWCIRIMKTAADRHLPLQNLHAVAANYTQEGQTTLHHRESLRERFRVMVSHYGWCSTLLMHAWFVIRAILKR